MAVESPIQETDNWFTGEDKVLQYTVEGQNPLGLVPAPVENIDGWTFEWKLYRRRVDDPIITKVTSAGVTIASAPLGLVDVIINADDTRDLPPDDSYRFVLRRTDPGMEQVLSYGGAVLRGAVQ